MGQLIGNIGNTLSGTQTQGVVAPTQALSSVPPTASSIMSNLPYYLKTLGEAAINAGQPPAQMPQQAAIAPQPAAQPPAALAGGQAQGLANAPEFVQQMVAQLMADRAANQQTSMGQGMPQQGMGMQGQFPQQAMQNMPFNMPMRSNYFFGPTPFGSNFQSMQQQPLSGGFGGFGGGQRGLFGFNPYMNSRIY